MQRNDTPSSERARPGVYNQVRDRFKRRIRGIWFRDGAYFAQLRLNGVVRQIKLHAATIPEAVKARQDLKSKIAKGEYPPKGAGSAEPESRQEKKVAELCDRSIPAAIAGYQRDRDLLKTKDPATSAREDSGLRKWVEFCKLKQETGSSVDIAALDSKMLKDFAVWRRNQALEVLRKELEDGEELPEDEPGISGRTLDLNVMALDHVLDWCIVEKLLPTRPVLVWSTLATEPEKIRLLTPGELDSFAKANLVTPEALAALPAHYRHLRARQARSAELFSDFIYLIFYCGGREYETRVQRWTNVTWSTKKVAGHIHFPGSEAKAGGGKPAEDRNVDFHTKLENHLKVMFERRDKSTDLMFPSIYDPQTPQGSFRKQLEHAREQTGQTDVAFHHGRHYFISHSVMAGADYKTIAYWVSHRDGGMLIGKKYSHLAPGHSKTTAQKLNGAF